MPAITILTPVYNRAEFLTRVFNCLQQQTDKDFEWIIIDDGSTDHSLEVARSFQTHLFPIRVLHKPNGGKHTALNLAHPYIQGKYVLILDSDDILVPDAIKIVKQAWGKYQDHVNIGMLIFLKGKDEQHPFCTVKQYNRPVDFMKCKRTYLLGRDCCEVVRSDLFKKFPFPEFPGEKFIGESALWNRIGKTHQCVYINEIIYLCEYLAGGLTQAGPVLRIKNPRGGMYVANTELTPQNSLKKRFKYGILYTCYGKFAGFSFARMQKDCANKILFYLTYPAGTMLYFYWKKKYLI